MNKIVALLLVAVMAISLAACGTTEAAPTTTAAVETTVDTTPVETTEAVEDTTPVETTEAAAPAAENEASLVLSTIWALYTDDNKFFAMGGDYNTPVDGAPGVVDVTIADFLMGSLIVPEAEVANIAEAASLIHAMNTNTFTCGVFHMTKDTDAKAFATAVRDNVQSARWMCGFPEKLIVAVIGGEYILLAFGVNDAMTPFETKLNTAYPDAAIAYNEAITG